MSKAIIVSESPPTEVVVPPPPLPPTPTKVVTFSWVGGRWIADVRLGEDDIPLTPRDFNLIVRTFTVKAGELRRLGYIEYLKKQREKNAREEARTKATGA